ncbi:hypothetical protein ACIRL2_46305 [Embleya sp. NPDC127516]|uniref:hypothetical protein n=1 Tax=Embleya sp. NPDC127516 TaxID=3363990 RepID=UPI00382B84B0
MPPPASRRSGRGVDGTAVADAFQTAAVVTTTAVRKTAGGTPTGGLPLGLRIAAARLRERPGWAVDDLVDRPADERHRLAEPATGDLPVRGSLELSRAARRGSADPVARTAARG